MRRIKSPFCLLAAMIAATALWGSTARADEVIADDGHVVDGNGGHLCDGGCNGGCFPRPGRSPDLFYNYYQPPGCGSVGATLYMSPSPVPRHVGHTYITYQPFMPHEYMYRHHRTYYQYYDGGRGLTRTHIKYYTPPLARVGQTLSYFKLAR